MMVVSSEGKQMGEQKIFRTINWIDTVINNMIARQMKGEPTKQYFDVGMDGSSQEERDFVQKYYENRGFLVTWDGCAIVIWVRLIH